MGLNQSERDSEKERESERYRERISASVGQSYLHRRLKKRLPNKKLCLMEYLHLPSAPNIVKNHDGF